MVSDAPLTIHSPPTLPLRFRKVVLPENPFVHCGMMMQVTYAVKEDAEHLLVLGAL